MNNKFFIIIFFFIEKIKSSEIILSPRQQIENILKLFKIPVDKEQDSYCPRKHTTSFDKNLCFYVSFTKRSRISARENCFKKSQRLVEIESNLTWNALLSSLAKFETEFREITATVKSFHIGVLKLQNNSYVWNQTELEINKKLLCTNSDLKPTSENKCANLRFVSLENVCFNVTECYDTKSIGYSICEWRGNSIEDYSSELYRELIKSYYVIFCVFLIYINILYLLYFIQNYRLKLQEALYRESDEFKISNLDVTNLKIFS